MKVAIVSKPFLPLERLAEYQREREVHLAKEAGATSIFIGTMRENSEGEQILSMQIEYYPGMTDQYIEKLAREISQRFKLLDILVVHRVGEIFPGETIVLLATWSGHRKAACEAEWHILEALKTRAPFWKKERLSERFRWVEKNMPGAAFPGV